MDGFERFAEGHLITLFSATNYCGKYGEVCPLPQFLPAAPQFIQSSNGFSLLCQDCNCPKLKKSIRTFES
jgi:hypothetical protein